jgi:hypothetical protein
MREFTEEEIERIAQATRADVWDEAASAQGRLHREFYETTKAIHRSRVRAILTAARAILAEPTNRV